MENNIVKHWWKNTWLTWRRYSKVSISSDVSSPVARRSLSTVMQSTWPALPIMCYRRRTHPPQGIDRAVRLVKCYMMVMQNKGPYLLKRKHFRPKAHSYTAQRGWKGCMHNCLSQHKAPTYHTCKAVVGIWLPQFSTSQNIILSSHFLRPKLWNHSWILSFSHIHMQSIRKSFINVQNIQNLTNSHRSGLSYHHL